MKANWPTDPEGKPSASYGARKLGEVSASLNSKIKMQEANLQFDTKNTYGFIR